MKRCSFFLVLLTLASPLGLRVHGQNPNAAAAIADRQDAEDRYKRLNAAVEDMLMAQATQQKRIAALEDELRALRMENARGTAQFATKADVQRFDDELRRLAKTIQEIDKKREADKRLILETIEELKKLIKSAAAAPIIKPPPPPPPPSPTASETATPEPPKDQKGFEHVVQSGETLLAIIGAYNTALKEKGVKGRITLNAVLQANPGLKAERMRIGQKIFMPEPAQ